MRLLSYSNDSLITLNRNEEKELPFYFRIPIKKIRGRIKNLQKNDSTAIDLNGSFTLVTAFGDFDLPIDQSLNVAVPTPPEIALSELQYLEEVDDVYHFLLKVNIHNKSPNILKLKDLKFNMDAENFLSSSGENKSAVSIPAKKSEMLEIPLSVAANDKLKLLGKIIRDDDNLDYELKMHATIVSVAGLEEEIPLDVWQKGNFELVDKSRKSSVKISRKD